MEASETSTRIGTILMPSDAMCRQIAADIRADYKRACEEAEQTGRDLNRLYFESINKKIQQKKQEIAEMNALKPSFLQWLLCCGR